MAASAGNKGFIVCFSINNRSLITPPTIACTRSKLSYFSVMIWAWALSLHKYENWVWVRVLRCGLLWEEPVFISACLSWGVSDKLHLHRPRAHAGTQTSQMGTLLLWSVYRYYDVCWIQGFSRYWQAGSPSPDINKQSEFATSKICQILARKLIYSLSILVTSHESLQVNASRYIPYSILTVNYLH